MEKEIRSLLEMDFVYALAHKKEIYEGFIEIDSKCQKVDNSLNDYLIGKITTTAAK
jgi:hypothetical protein